MKTAKLNLNNKLEALEKVILTQNPEQHHAALAAFNEMGEKWVSLTIARLVENLGHVVSAALPALLQMLQRVRLQPLRSPPSLMLRMRRLSITTLAQM
jgi:uncharacterized protein YjaG (DUF416 family)